MAQNVIYWKFNNNTLYIRGTSASGYTSWTMYFHPNINSIPWRSNKENIKTVVIETTIDVLYMNYWFYDCKNLTSIKNSNNTIITNLENYVYNITEMKSCFSGCTSFNQPITIPSSITDMSSCFRGCTSFNQPIIIPSSVTDISACFMNCTSFNRPITITSSVTNAGSCFEGCTSFNSQIIFEPPSSVEYLGHFLSGCTSFNQPITIPSSVTNMMDCFYNCASFNQSIIIPSNVTTMNYCFGNCTSFNQPITIPNNVTDIYACFKGCTSFNQSIIIPSSVTRMSFCFEGCTSLNETIIIHSNGDYIDIFINTSLPIFITGRSQELEAIAANYSNVNVIILANCAEFDSVDGTLRIFYSTTEYTDGETIDTKTYYTDIDQIAGATNPKWYSIRNSIIKIIIEDLFKPKTGYCLFSSNSLTSIEFFKYNAVVEPNIADINSYYEYDSETEKYFLTEDQTIGEKTYYTRFSTFDTSNVTDMRSMFNDCQALTTLDVSGFDTSNITDMSYMFYNCQALTTLNVSGFITSNVATMQSMFYNCNSLVSLDLSNFNTSNVTSMSFMFYNCTSLTSLDLFSFDTSNVINMCSMFDSMTNLTTINNILKLNTSNVTNMSNMFNDCRALTSLDLSSFDTSKVTNMNGMFGNCILLTSLDLSNFDTSSIINMGYMFYNCSSLTCNDIFIHINSYQTAIPVPLNYTNAFYGTVNTLYIDGTNPFLDQIAATCNNNNVYVCRNTEFTTDLSRMICNENNTLNDLSDDTYEEDEDGSLAFIKINILNGIFQPNSMKFKLSSIDLIDGLSSTACNWYGSYDTSTKQFSNPINFNTDAIVGNIIYGVSTNEILSDETKILTIQIKDPFNQIFSLTDTISPRFYTIDFLAGGKEISFGYKAQADDLYEVLTVQPSDWNTKWYDYYKKNENNEYIEIDDISAPSFASGTYYKKIHDSLFKCEMDASFKNNMVSITNNQFSVGNNILTISRNGVINCSDIVISNLIGEIKMFAGSIIPTGWLVCDGTEQLIADYPLLAAVLGNTWGTPSDANHFKLPNLKGRVPIGQDTSDTDFSSLGKIDGGSKTHAHTTGNFTLQTTHMPAHTHTTSAANEYYITSSKSTANNTRVAYSSSGNRLVDGQTDTSTSSFHHRWETASVGGGSAHNHGNTGDSSNVQPYAVVNYIICAI